MKSLELILRPKTYLHFWFILKKSWASLKHWSSFMQHYLWIWVHNVCLVSGENPHRFCVGIYKFFSMWTRKKVIGLDDLLSDYYKEKSKVVEKEYKQVKNQKNYNSDEDVNTKEESLTKVINQCEHQAQQFSL